MDKIQYVCPKCGCTSYEADEIHTTGSDLSRLLNLQNKRFTTVSCTACGYTELYKSQTSKGMDILDILMGS